MSDRRRILTTEQNTDVTQAKINLL